jgi:hypothetical protein
MTVHPPVSKPPPSRSSTRTNATVHCPPPTGEIPASNGGTPPEVGPLRPFQADLAHTMRAPESTTGRLRRRGGVEVAPYPEVTALSPKWIAGAGTRP